MNKDSKILLVLAAILVLVGFLKPDLSNVLNPNRPATIDVLELVAPTDEAVKEKADKVVEILKAGEDHKVDAKRLRDLYLDLGQLVSLDGENEVIKNTEEIRQANSLSGVMLRLDLKGKYPELAAAAKDVMVTAIGDDQILLSPELRKKAVDGFNALAWACNEGSK